jgi:hypothetical protein
MNYLSFLQTSNPKFLVPHNIFESNFSCSEGCEASISPLICCGSMFFGFFCFSILKGGFFHIFSVLYSTLLHLPPLRFLCAGGYWDRTQ